MSSVFDPSASWIPKQLKKPVKEALDAGWTPADKRLGGGGWFIYSPKRTEKFCVPITCKDPDDLAKVLRSLISKAYLNEPSAFRKTPPQAEAGYIQELADMAIMKGATIIPGETPFIRCPVCDEEYEGWEAFANHQEACDRVAHAAKQEQQVPEEQGEADRPSEDASQSVPDSTKPAQSGTIGTKEETPLASEDTTTPTPTPKKRKGGYTWTHVEEPLHKLLYEAIRYTRRWKGETDSKWAKRLAQYIDEEGLLNTLVFEVDVDARSAHVLDQIRELLGEEPGNGASEEEIEQFKKDLAEKDEQIAALTRKVGEYGDFFSAMSEMAPKEAK